MKSVKESIENGRLICNCCGEAIKPDEVAFDGKDALGNIVHICIDCDGKEDFIEDDFTEDDYADEIDDYYDSAEIFESVIKESTSDLTEEQKKAIQNMVQEDFEVGHPANGFNDIRRDFADDEMFNSNMNTIDAAAKYYIELVEMGPAGIMDEITDGWSDDYKAEYSDIFDDTGHERIGICPNCGHEITDEDEILDDSDESVIGKHACPRCDEIYEDHEDLFESITKNLQESGRYWNRFIKRKVKDIDELYVGADFSDVNGTGGKITDLLYLKNGEVKVTMATYSDKTQESVWDNECFKKGYGMYFSYGVPEEMPKEADIDTPIGALLALCIAKNDRDVRDLYGSSNMDDLYGKVYDACKGEKETSWEELAKSSQSFLKDHVKYAIEYCLTENKGELTKSQQKFMKLCAQILADIKEALGESVDNLSENVIRENRSCWEDFYKELMSHVEADNDPDNMIAAIDKIDRIHAKCGAFKNMDESDKEEVNNACDILAGASSYSLYQTFEAMSDYFGFDELVESAQKNKNHELHESVDKWQDDIDFEIRRCRAIFYYDSNLLYQVENAFDLSFEEDSIYEEQKLYGTINGTAELIARWDLNSDDKVKAVYDAISKAKNAPTDTSTDDDEEKYNVYCIYDDDQGGEEDGDPRNEKPLNYEETVELMKKLMNDFKNGELSGSYRWSPTSDGEDCYLVIRAYPNCDTDTLIMKSYDWKTKYGFEMKAGEIYP